MSTMHDNAHRGRAIRGNSELSERPQMEYCDLDNPEAVDDVSISKAEISYFNKLLNEKLFDGNDMDVEILRLNPEHPLHSAKTFEEMEIDPSVLKGILNKGFRKPSSIQERALPNLLGENPVNMIAQAQSGTGKTAIFIIAMLCRVQLTPYCQCLALAPTRELALQIRSVAQQLAAFMPGITIGAAVREPEVNVDAKGNVTDQIVIGTPGTVAGWSRCVGPIKLNPNLLTIFCLDEADIMMEQESFMNISMRIKSKLSPNCQLLLFSATYDDKVIEFAREFVPNPLELRVRQTKLALDNIKQYYMIFSHWRDKYMTFARIYETFSVGHAIIFCDTRREVVWLRDALENDGFQVSIFSGDLDVKQREEVINKFRKGEIRILVATNVCARGYLPLPENDFQYPAPRNRPLTSLNGAIGVGWQPVGQSRTTAVSINQASCQSLPASLSLQSYNNNLLDSQSHARSSFN